MSHFVYLARCSDQSLYCGTCLDLKEREAKHNEGKGAKYTRSRLPIKIIYYEKCASLGDARRREIEIKKMTRSAKEDLVG